MPSNGPELLTIGTAARYLGVSVDTLRRWDRDGRLKSVRLTATGHRRYRQADLDAMISHSHEATS